MAMDALRNISTNVPDWLKRLEELTGQIDQRQVELAALTEGQSTARSVKNKGSTESLKPKNEEPAFASPAELSPAEALPQPPPPIVTDRSGAVTPPEQKSKEAPAPVSPARGTPLALQKQTQQAMAVAQARARAQVRKRHRTESVISAEGAPAKYRTRSMIIVYYDSYVQSFFEELVKFISASRNLMRKAKMAAKVAQIKRLAELEMPDDDDDDEDGPTEGGEPSLAPLPGGRFVSTRMMRSSARNQLPSFVMAGGRGLLGDKGPDAYDELDKGLEYVQSMSETAAHQFLRDGDCSEEIVNLQRRLAETKELAEKEMERVQREESELASETEPGKVRRHKQAKMRREETPKREELAPSTLPASTAMEVDDKKPEAPSVSVEMQQPLEVDPMLEADDDEGLADMDEPLPKLVYKSTRQLRSMR
jgi:hypothetical protein